MDVVGDDGCEPDAAPAEAPETCAWAPLAAVTPKVEPPAAAGVLVVVLAEAVVAAPAPLAADGAEAPAPDTVCTAPPAVGLGTPFAVFAAAAGGAPGPLPPEDGAWTTAPVAPMDVLALEEVPAFATVDGLPDDALVLAIAGGGAAAGVTVVEG